MSNNGDGELETIGDEVEDQPKPKNVLDSHSLDSLFKVPEHTDTTRLLMTPGSHEIPAIFMRADYPNNRTILALIGFYQKCSKHNYDEGKAMVLMLSAALTSKQGKRASMVSDTIIGEKHSSNRDAGRGMKDKVKDFVSGGQGD